MNTMTQDQTTQPTTQTPPLPTVTLSNVTFHALTEQQVIEHILNELDASHGGWVVTPNLDIVRRYNLEPEFRELIKPVTLTVADGMPLIWASKVQGTPLPERVAGSNLTATLPAGAATRGHSIFLLGGDEGTAEKAATILKERHPDLKVAGTYCPPFGFEKDQSQIDIITQMLTDTKPDIIFVALGCPKQERIIEMFRHHLPNAWWLGIGISFSFICGDVKRAPKWMQKCGLEWVHRLCQEPGRLAKRYLLHDIPFAFRLLFNALRQRFSRS